MHADHRCRDCLSAAHAQSYYMKEIVIYAGNIACHEEIQPFVLPRACRYTPAIHIGSGVANGGPGWTWPVQFISEIPVSCIWLLCMQVTLYSKSLRQ